MRVKGWKLMVALAVMGASSLTYTANSQAADPAPGEGAYVGAFVGFGMGVLQAKVQTLPNSKVLEAGTYETDRGGLGLEGIQGGGWLGFGLKTADDLYIGLEISGAGSDEKIELTASPGIKQEQASGEVITTMTAERNWTAGGALRVGYYVNADTLFALKGGVAVSQFDVTIGSSKKTYYAGGPQIGASIETRLSKVDPNLSLRIEYAFTDYLTADIQGHDGLSDGSGAGNNSELTGYDSAGRVGVQYSF